MQIEKRNVENIKIVHKIIFYKTLRAFCDLVGRISWNVNLFFSPTNSQIAKLGYANSLAGKVARTRTKNKLKASKSIVCAAGSTHQSERSGRGLDGLLCKFKSKRAAARTEIAIAG